MFYTASRYVGNRLRNDIEYIIQPNAVNDFKNNIDLYTAAANLFYLNGIPSDGQIALAAGDYVDGLTKMWGEALKEPQYYVYLAHILVATSTNLQAVNSTSITFDGKINFVSETRSSSEVSILIKNRTALEYRQLIQDKFPNSAWKPNSSGEVELFVTKNIKYVGRYQNKSGYYYVIEYFRNGERKGKFRFKN